MRALPLVLLLSLPAVAGAQSADREGTWEAGLKLIDMSGEFVQGSRGASLDVEGDLTLAARLPSFFPMPDKALLSAA